METSEPETPETSKPETFNPETSGSETSGSGTSESETPDFDPAAATARQSAASLGVLLITGTHERAHYAFVVASAAAALGRRVVLFATNTGCRALVEDWSVLDDVGRDAMVRRRGVAGLGELRDSACELGVRMMACEAGLRAEGIDAASLCPAVEVTGIASFLEAVGQGQMISL